MAGRRGILGQFRRCNPVPYCNRLFGVVTIGGMEDFLPTPRRNSRRKSNAPWIAFAVVVAVAAVGIAVGLLASRETAKPGSTPLSLVTGEPDKAERDAVRAWLKENTNDGWFEEVKWGPARKRLTEEQVKQLIDNERGRREDEFELKYKLVSGPKKTYAEFSEDWMAPIVAEKKRDEAREASGGSHSIADATTGFRQTDAEMERLCKAAYEEYLASYGEYESRGELSEPIETPGNPLTIRLRHRTHNRLGAVEIDEDVFNIRSKGGVLAVERVSPQIRAGYP